MTPSQTLELTQLRTLIADIAAMTNADDPESYRCDDPQACLCTISAMVTAAMQQQPNP